MSCCSLKVSGLNPVLGKFFKKKFHRGGAKGARDRILKTIGLSSGILKHFSRLGPNVWVNSSLREGEFYIGSSLQRHSLKCTYPF